MIYFISDTHFYHKNIAESRGLTVEEMNTLMINNWNNIVNEDDEVYILGDLFYRATIEQANEILNNLNGTKHLVIGNHDKHYLKRKEFNKHHFKTIKDIIEFNYEGYHFFLCHYPVIDWNRKHYGSIHLYGHIHDNISYESILGPQSINVSVELIEYTPISINKIIEKITGFTKRYSYSH
ncbi:hydrolase [Macrococcus epidermidis]|uniref:Hydrolase n=1 Tax=Macrococcus epidermidis TaxID=1902580 RepID=A0A327ZUS2_9STAP|nr:hydrolase [Macrococcus epidermidis]